MIEAQGVEFNYRAGSFALRLTSLTVAEGERVAVVGPSGAGKTTLLHLIAGILTPDRGRIRVHGMELTDLGPDDRRDLRLLKLGLIFQDLELLEYLDLLDNVLLPYRVSPFLELDREARDRAAHLLEAVGLGARSSDRPARLSKGERQRVAFARALATQPSLVLADEPTGNLDGETRDRVAELLFAHADQAGATLVVVSHDPELVGRFDRVVDVRELP
jgi:putative ABC transport system ATP-binding protein